MDNARILLANLLQSSRSTLSRGSFLSFFAFKEGMLDTQISALGGWPTVSGSGATNPILKINVGLLAGVGDFWTGQHACRSFSLLGVQTEYGDFGEAWVSDVHRAGGDT
jgi:hypothetical protein